MRYRYFDPEAATTTSMAHLPHWEQAGGCYFITFRAADSLPLGACKALAENQPQIDRGQRRTSRAWHEALDTCHGECLLRSPGLRSHVVETLRHGDGTRYDLEGFIVMPNHVHVLAGFAESGAMQRQCRNWKHYSASAINRDVGRRGCFWQWESYDHLVRDPVSLQRFRDYLDGNPRQAHLRPDEYTLYLRPTSIMEL